MSSKPVFIRKGCLGWYIDQRGDEETLAVARKDVLYIDTDNPEFKLSLSTGKCLGFLDYRGKRCTISTNSHLRVTDITLEQVPNCGHEDVIVLGLRATQLMFKMLHVKYPRQNKA